MKTTYQKILFAFECMAAAATMLLTGCGKSEINTYSSKAKLWFTQDYLTYNPTTKHDANDVERFFALVPGKETLDVPFEINLIGAIAGHDRVYSVIVVDSLTTAVASEYRILPTVFRAGTPVDTLWVQLIKSSRLADTEVKLSFLIVENDNFTIGYDQRMSASIAFNNITTKPDWWNKNIEISYLGPFTKKKFDAFYAFYGKNEIDGLSSSDLRKLAFEFRDYIEQHKIKDDDGLQMTVPVI